jgi:hypothetical protein
MKSTEAREKCAMAARGWHLCFLFPQSQVRLV